MTGNVVSNKFTGDSASAQKAIAELEKKVEDLNKAFTEGKSKAKSAAIAAKEAAKAAEDASKQAAAAAKADAAESRKVLRQWVANKKQADADAAASRKVFHAEVRRLEQEDLNASRKAAREKKRIEREAAAARKESANEANSGVRGWLIGLVGVQALYSGITGGLKEAIEAQKELMRLTDEQGRAQDRRTRNFGVNAGLNIADSKVAAAAINQVAVKTGFKAEQLEPAASEMVGSGATWQDASGQGLTNLVQATGVTGGGSLEDAAGSMGLTLKAAGLDNTPANIRRVGQNIYALRKKGRTEMESLRPLASELSIAKDQPLEDNLALMGTFEDVTDSSKAAGAFGSLQRRLRAPNAEVKKAMAMAKLKPQDVDFIGEDTGKVIDTLSAAMKSLPEEKRGAFIKGIAGGDYLGQTDYLLKNPERFKELRAAQNDKAGYEDAIKQKFSGVDFAMAAGEEEKRQQLAGMMTPETARATQRDLLRIKGGDNAYRSSLIQGAGTTALAAGIDPTVGEAAAGSAFGLSKTRMVGMALPMLAPMLEGLSIFNQQQSNAGLNAEARQTVENRIGDDKLVKALEENNRLVQENNDIMKNRPGAQPKRPVPVKAGE